MRVTRRQLRRIIRESASPSLESLFAKGAPYDTVDRTQRAIVDIAKKTPGLEQKIRKILGPAQEDGGNFFYYLGQHLNLVSRSWALGSPEWVEYASNLIRQAGIEEEFINYKKEYPAWAAVHATPPADEPRQPGDPVPIDANTGTDLAVDAMGADDAVDSVSGDVTDPVFLRQLAGWLQQMDKNPAVQMIMFNLD